MMETPYIPLSLLRDLRCRQCEHFVSGGPVFVVPDGSLLCGRCRELAINIYQNSSYEALASMFRYPCKNWENHCPRSLSWHESFDHEERCTYNGCCNLFWKHPKAYLKGKREIPLGDIRLIAIPEYLLDYIKCCQCEGYLSCDPVFIRTDGKNICHRCVFSNGVPPNTIRNAAYEILSNIIIFPCVFRNRGCPTRLKFGTDLWQHESKCSYNQMFKKAVPTVPKNPYQKERGVIQTHSGHYYGTITPNTAPFSPPPPSPTVDFDVNKQLVKSLKKQQERRFLRAEEIQSSIRKKNSEDGSEADMESVRRNSHERGSSSEASTPTRLDENDNRQRQRRESVLLQRDSGYYSHGSSDRTENNYQNTHLAQLHQEDSTSRQISRSNSYNQPKNPTAAFFPRNDREYIMASRSNSYNKPFSPIPDTNGVKIPFQNIDFSILAGHYPIFGSQYENGKSQGNGLLVPKPSFKDLIRSDSLSGNKEFMAELKQRQNRMLKKNNPPADSPYKECNNLEEILQVHDEIDS